MLEENHFQDNAMDSQPFFYPMPQQTTGMTSSAFSGQPGAIISTHTSDVFPNFSELPGGVATPTSSLIWSQQQIDNQQMNCLRLHPPALQDQNQSETLSSPDLALIQYQKLLRDNYNFPSSNDTMMQHDQQLQNGVPNPTTGLDDSIPMGIDMETFFHDMLGNYTLHKWNRGFE